ncbi:flagellar hook assembly protein FlgD [Thiorhodovibrio frisius]|uniref:Basal-body rod modification protein FlgD n=1 Tax=Thiorhodovibrio frisius TaxID=631362 RepID=H8YZP4_9GAMM|nr:flagellar hook capping FlgD N-terminal domain-containing protein [Thiorhodovibrio frisius]EIC22171.1 flagellar hook capping protein [Thiorhodovibrio frisius]WPL24465.1 Basal-body rod modification protein FlgD [Thiorhodovibrio frisius]
MSDFSTESLQSLGLAPTPQVNTEQRGELGQEDFLKLLSVQLSTQDPMKPVENTDFIGQMAQFSTLTGIESLTQSFETLSQSLSQGQALQAATLVGHDVLIPAEFSQLAEGGTISGAIDLQTSATSASIEVLDASGATVSTLALENTGAGLQQFEWDGLLSNGVPAPPGVYQFRATVVGNEGTEAAETFLNKRVETVAISEDGTLELSVPGMESIGFSDVRRIS